MINYFKLFKIPQKININQKKLSERFYKLQQKFHPDQFIGFSSAEQKKSLKKSILINKGYRTLKIFFSRAKYILSLHGFTLLNINNFMIDKKFLVEQFEISEKLQNINKKPNNFTKINKMKLYIKDNIKLYKNQIIYELKQKNWEKGIYSLQKLSFFQKKYIFIKSIKNEYNL